MNLKGFFLASLVAIFSLSATAHAKPIVLRGITSWQAEYDMSKAFMLFQDMVNERLAGKVDVRYLGGPEIAAPNNQVEALKNGVVDIVLTAAAYYRSEVPIAAAAMFTTKSPTALRKSGFADIMKELHAEAGIEYLANAGGGKKYRLYFTTPIETPDLSGKTIRVSPVYLPLVKALNGHPVSISPNELYTALERGVVQGYGWPETGIRELGLHEKTRYVLDHPFYSSDTALLMNKSAYDQLPADIRAVLQDIAVEFEGKVEAMIAEHLAVENDKLRADGLTFIRFSEQDTERFLKIAYESGWQEFLTQNAAQLKASPDLAARLEAAGR